MKKYVKIILILLAATLVLAAAGALYWFHTPGIHFLGPFGHIELEEDCYLYDLAGRKEGCASVRISGNIRRSFFKGIITVEGVDSNGDTKGIHEHPFGNLEGERRILYIDNRFSFREDGTLYPNMDGYYFYVYFEQDGAFILNVEHQQDRGNSREYLFTAIYAESEAAADAQYSQGKARGIIP